MDSQHHQKMRDKVKVEEDHRHDQHQQLSQGKLKQEEAQQARQQAVLVPPSSTSSVPPSASSSPAHEFSFTISLHHPNKATKAPPSSLALDLSPADEIFFHGHLLPLHLLSHLPVSPRSSTNSLDSFTLPIKEIKEDQNPNKTTPNNNNSNNISSHETKERERPKSKSFSFLSRWRKGFEVREKEEKEKHKRKLRFDVSQVLKRYMRMVRPLLSFRGRRENIQLRRQPYSFSGSLSPRPRGKQDQLRGRRGEFSAPASMRTSPTNSGHLLTTGAAVPTNSTSDSTMEELQAAIQAAIAHCKNSIAMEDKING